MSNTSLTHSPADIARRLLVNLGHGTLPSAGGLWPIGVYTEPDSPDNCVTLFDTNESGAQDDRVMQGDMAERYSFQVRVRGVDDRTAWRKMNDIRVSLGDAYEVSLAAEGSTYAIQAFVKIGNVISLGKDVQTGRRSLYVLNAQVVVRQLS